MTTFGMSLTTIKQVHFSAKRKAPSPQNPPLEFEVDPAFLHHWVGEGGGGVKGSECGIGERGPNPHKRRKIEILHRF